MPSSSASPTTCCRRTWASRERSPSTCCATRPRHGPCWAGPSGHRTRLCGARWGGIWPTRPTSSTPASTTTTEPWPPSTDGGSELQRDRHEERLEGAGLLDDQDRVDP